MWRESFECEMARKYSDADVSYRYIPPPEFDVLSSLRVLRIHTSVSGTKC